MPGFREFIHEDLNKRVTAPVMVMLRRVAIRQFPGNESVALYVNPQLQLQVAVPVDTLTGKLKPANVAPVREALEEELRAHKDQSQWREDAHRAGATRFDYREPPKELRAHHGGHTVAYSKTGHVVGTWNHQHNLGIIEEQHNEYSEGMSREELIRALTDAYQDTEDTDSELEAAIHHWLKAEQEEFGEFPSMPEENLRDNWDDYCALMAGAQEVSEEALNELKAATLHSYVSKSFHSSQRSKSLKTKDKRIAGQVRALHRLRKLMDRSSDIAEAVAAGKKPRNQRTVRGYPEWYKRAEKRGEDVSFRLHNNASSTSAFKAGRHIGTYHHHLGTGTLHEDVLTEAPIHRISTIMKKGEEEEVKFRNGAALRVHPVTAKAVHDLWHRVNRTNKDKLSELINSSPEGLVKVAKYSDMVLNTANKGAH